MPQRRVMEVSDENTIISAEGAKLLAKLGKEHDEKLKKCYDDFEKNKDIILRERGQGPGLLERVGIAGKSKVEESTDPRFWALVNVESLKEFVKYGANKVMDQIRVRTHAAVIAREELEKLKKKNAGIDPKTMGFTIVILVICACMAYIMISSFFNFDTVNKENIGIKRELGDMTGKLAACQSELAVYRPGSPVIGPDQTLEG